MSARVRTIVAIVLAVALGLSVATWLRASKAVATIDADAARLRAIEEADVALGVALLESRAGILRHYDPIVRRVADLRDGERMAAELHARGAEANDLAREVDAIASEVRAKEQSVETLKTDLALLRSSSRYFPTAVATLSRRGGDLAEKVEALRADVERFQAAPSRGVAERIEGEIAALDASRDALDGDGQNDLGVVIGHARAIVERRERIDRLARAVSQSTARAHAVAARGMLERDGRRALMTSSAACAASVSLAIAELLLVASALVHARKRRVAASPIMSAPARRSA